MKIALVEPYLSVDSLKSYAEKAEPSHLVGMYSLLKQNGCDVVLLDAYSYRFSVAKLVEWLETRAVTHVGLTVYDYLPCLTYVRQFFDRLPENISTIIGGPGPTYCTDRMIQLLKPDWLVKGAGELAMLGLFKSEFSRQKLSYTASGIGQTTIVASDLMRLDDIPFERPYDLEEYGFHVSPRIQTGCIGNCIFCSGAYQKKFDYISGNKAQQMFEYLINQKNADVIAPNGPDFTAIPQKANKLVQVLTEGNYRFSAFHPGVRLDTLSRAIALDTSIWKKVAASYTISFESSIESFSWFRMQRLGKSMPADFFDNILTNLAKIIRTCNCKIVLGRIAIDPTITVDEFMIDCEGYMKLLREFPDHITVGGMFMNEFVSLAGTPSTEDSGTDNPWLWSKIFDPVMRHLHEKLLNNNQFRKWCSLAEQLRDFGERNLVFEEILRVAGEQAKELKALCVD